MQYIDPTGADLKRLRDSVPADQPIVMLNLLRYRDEARYPADSDHSPCSGAEAYGRYSKVAIKKIREVGGDLLWAGKAQTTVIGPEAERWHDVLLVKYPSVDAFLRMVSMPDYRAATVHRTAGLADTRLVATVETGG